MGDSMLHNHIEYMVWYEVWNKNAFATQAVCHKSNPYAGDMKARKRVEHDRAFTAIGNSFWNRTLKCSTKRAMTQFNAFGQTSCP